MSSIFQNVLASSACITILLLVYRMRRNYARRNRPKTITVIVLGDIARSPRMMYHAQSLLDHHWNVRLVGYGPTILPETLKNAHVTCLSPSLGFASKAPRLLFLLLAPSKVVMGAVKLLLALALYPPSQYFLVQNPPALPTLLIAQIAKYIDGSRLIIDWHNTGSSILGIRLGQRHPLVGLADKLEGFFGKHAYAHLFVSHAMQRQLVRSWSLSGKHCVLHDRPPSNFRRLEENERKALFDRLPQLQPPQDWLLAVSSTSWTADEDFKLLLDALSTLQDELRKRRSSNGLCVVITGKGPLKRDFESSLKARQTTEGPWDRVKVVTAWLEYADYPKLLGAADFGISLHSSSSGVDLPMKVVDMFGCRLPVLALEFPALSELVKDGANGRIFEDADQLGRLLLEILKNPQQTERLRKGIDSSVYSGGRRWSTWSENWDATVLPLLK